MNFRDLKDIDKIYELINQVEYRYKSDILSKTIFPKQRLEPEEVKLFTTLLIDYIIDIIHTPSMVIDGTPRYTDYEIGYSINDLTSSIIKKMNTLSVIIFYNLELDRDLDDKGRKVYRCRIAIYDDKINRRNNKINKILNDI